MSSAVTRSVLECGVYGKSWCHRTSVAAPGNLELTLVWWSFTSGPIRSATMSTMGLSAITS